MAAKVGQPIKRIYDGLNLPNCGYIQWKLQTVPSSGFSTIAVPTRKIIITRTACSYGTASSKLGNQGTGRKTNVVVGIVKHQSDCTWTYMDLNPARRVRIQCISTPADVAGELYRWRGRDVTASRPCSLQCVYSERPGYMHVHCLAYKERFISYNYVFCVAYFLIYPHKNPKHLSVYSCFHQTWGTIL